MILDFFKTKEDNSLQTHKEAKIDLMILFMYIDKNLEIREDELIKKVAKNMQWSNLQLPIDIYINKSIAKTREVLINTSKFDKYLDDIESRLENYTDKKEAFRLAEKIMNIDENRDDSEIILLEKIKIKFNIR